MIPTTMPTTIVQLPFLSLHWQPKCSQQWSALAFVYFPTTILLYYLSLSLSHTYQNQFLHAINDSKRNMFMNMWCDVVHCIRGGEGCKRGSTFKKENDKKHNEEQYDGVQWITRREKKEQYKSLSTQRWKQVQGKSREYTHLSIRTCIYAYMHRRERER